MKRFIGDIKFVIATIWAETDPEWGPRRLTLIARGIVILASVSLSYIMVTLFVLIRWIVL